jgi:hypothetical protein
VAASTTVKPLSISDRDYRPWRMRTAGRMPKLLMRLVVVAVGGFTIVHSLI